MSAETAYFCETDNALTYFKPIMTGTHGGHRFVTYNADRDINICFCYSVAYKHVYRKIRFDNNPYIDKLYNKKFSIDVYQNPINYNSNTNVLTIPVDTTIRYGSDISDIYALTEEVTMTIEWSQSRYKFIYFNVNNK